MAFASLHDLPGGEVGDDEVGVEAEHAPGEDYVEHHEDGEHCERTVLLAECPVLELVLVQCHRLDQLHRGRGTIQRVKAAWMVWVSRCSQKVHWLFYPTQAPIQGQ